MEKTVVVEDTFQDLRELERLLNKCSSTEFAHAFGVSIDKSFRRRPLKLLGLILKKEEDPDQDQDPD